MVIEIQRNDLVLMCRQIASLDPGKVLSVHKYKDAFEIKPFTNGPNYRLSEAWAKEQTIETLIDFYFYHSPTIKLITP